GLKVIYYISPQLWAWRAHRVRAVRRDVDLLLAILPFEPEWYAQRGVAHVEFVGHPLAGAVYARYDRAEFCRRHQLDPARPIVALAPNRSPTEAALIIAATTSTDRAAPSLRLVEHETREALAAADAAAVTSGTATLETALLGTPLVVVYKESALNWHILGRLI